MHKTTSNQHWSTLTNVSLQLKGKFERVSVSSHTVCVCLMQRPPDEQRGLLSTLYKNNAGSRVCFANFVDVVRRKNFRRILKFLML